jgi:hypothetical protein
MQNPLVKKDLVDAILELRADVERQLQANKYYVALSKLDELLAAIRPLEIEATAVPVETPKEAAQAEAQAEAEAAAAAEFESDGGRTWSGIVKESVIEGDTARTP